MNLTIDDLYRLIAEQAVENFALKKRVQELTPKPEEPK